MNMRAPDPKNRPVYEDSEHSILGHWEPSRWWRVLDHDGGLWLETSNSTEAKEAAANTGYTLERRHDFIPAVVQWHEQETP